MQNYFFYFLCLMVLSGCTHNKPSAKLTTAEHAKLGQQIIDFYHKYSKGYYDAMQNNLADTVKLFRHATYVSAQKVVEKMKHRASLTRYTPDLSSLVKGQNMVQLKVKKQQGKQPPQLMQVRIQFNKAYKILSYQEKPMGATNTPEASPNYAQYNGKYVAASHQAIHITWQQGSHLAYKVTLTSPQCLGEFSGKAFFIDKHTAVGNQGGECTLTFDFSQPHQVTIHEPTHCSTRQTRKCFFKGIYVTNHSNGL